MHLQFATHPNKEIADCGAAKVWMRSDGGSDIALSASEMLDREVAEGECLYGDHPACHKQILIRIYAKQHIICEFEILNCSHCFLQMN